MDNVFGFTFTYVSHDFFYSGKACIDSLSLLTWVELIVYKERTDKKVSSLISSEVKKKVSCEVRYAVGHIAIRHFVRVCFMVFAMAVMQKVL